MTEKISYSKLAADAMCRAAQEAQRKAAELDLKIPVWKEGKIIYMDPKEMLTKKCS